MWEYYYRHPEDFIIKMHETLHMVSPILTAQSTRRDISSTGNDTDKEYTAEVNTRLSNIVGAMVRNDTKALAEEVKRTRIILRPQFYFTALVLAVAIVLGLCILTGIEGPLFPFSLSPSNIVWAVGIPIGLSIFGIALCLALIRNII